jgi:hypothetical protein
MKFLRSISILSMALTVTACGPNGKSFKVQPDQAQTPAKTTPKDVNKPTVETTPLPDSTENSANPTTSPTTNPTPSVPETNSPPEGQQPSFKVGENYVIKNQRQEFRLNLLSHLVATNFTCKVQLKEEMPNTAVKLVDGEMKITFYPQFKIIFRNEEFASINTLCGEDTDENGLIGKGTGGLFKNGENSYILNYRIETKDPVRLQMKWDAAGKTRGTLSCMRTTEKRPFMTGTIDACTIDRNQQVK